MKRAIISPILVRSRIKTQSMALFLLFDFFSQAKERLSVVTEMPKSFAVI